MHRRIACLLVTVVMYVPGAVRAQGPQAIKWRTDYAQARKEALDKNLPLIVDFVMQGCVPCKKLEETTFRDAKVMGLINEKFIPLKIEQEKDAELVSKLRINGFPTIMLAGPDLR